MATLATVCSRLFIKDAARSAAEPKQKAIAPVRAFANEDIYFYVKRIDNSRLVRQPIRGGWGLLETIGSMGAAALC
jgi:hypothetical protein